MFLKFFYVKLDDFLMGFFINFDINLDIYHKMKNNPNIIESFALFGTLLFFFGT